MSTEPVGLARDLAPQGVMRAQIGDTDLAIWRSTNGNLSAWENRCPHRGMRLSHGFVRGESLACAYHGWHYDCAGTCHYIPAHPELEPPKTIKPIIYNITEQADVLWVSTNGNANPPSLPNNIVGVRSITLQCKLTDAINAFSTVSTSDDLSIDINSADANNPLMLSFNTATISNAVFVLFQQPDEQRVVCHVVAVDTFTTFELICLSRWCESVRRQAEVNLTISNDKNSKA